MRHYHGNRYDFGFPASASSRFWPLQSRCRCQSHRRSNHLIGQRFGSPDACRCNIYHRRRSGVFFEATRLLSSCTRNDEDLYSRAPFLGLQGWYLPTLTKKAFSVSGFRAYKPCLKKSRLCSSRETSVEPSHISSLTTKAAANFRSSPECVMQPVIFPVSKNSSKSLHATQPALRRRTRSTAPVSVSRAR